MMGTLGGNSKFFPNLQEKKDSSAGWEVNFQDHRNLRTEIVAGPGGESGWREKPNGANTQREREGGEYKKE